MRLVLHPPSFLSNSKDLVNNNISLCLCLFLCSPHTGWQEYQHGVKRIPTACITVEDAELMWHMAQRGQKIVVRLTMGAKTLPDADSFNIVAEIKGKEHPEQVTFTLPRTYTCLVDLYISDLCISVYHHATVSLFQSFTVGLNLLSGPSKETVLETDVLLELHFWKKDYH